MGLEHVDRQVNSVWPRQRPSQELMVLDIKSIATARYLQYVLFAHLIRIIFGCYLILKASVYQLRFIIRLRICNVIIVFNVEAKTSII